MELIQHWAGISFSAQNGDPEGAADGRRSPEDLPFQMSSPGPADFRPGALHGITESWLLWPASGGCGCASRSAAVFFSVSALCSSAEGFGQDVLSFSRSCFGSKGLSGSSSRWG